MIRRLRKFENYYKITIILVDLVMINLSYIISFLIKFNGQLPEFNFVSYLEAAPFITLAAVLFFDLNGILAFYKKSIYDILKSIAVTVMLIGVTAIAITYLLQNYSFPRSVLLMAPVVQFMILGAWKVALKRIRYIFIKEKNAMLIANTDDLKLIVPKIAPVLKQEKSTIRYIFQASDEKLILKCLKKVDEIIICPDVPAPLKISIISSCMGSRQVVYVVPQLFEISLLNSKIKQFGDIPAFMINNLGLSVEQRFLKRVFDVVLALFGIIILSPALLLIALMIRLSSEGPALYTQERMTIHNKIFKVYKFRTMHKDAESETGPVLAAENDPRVTKIGRFLRKFRLDELPQLFNVLKGDMSIVGPRPERPCFVEEFCHTIPEYNHRYSVRAGMTGYAQVLGDYSTTPEDKLRYDLMYIKNYSLLLDIKLILQTITVVLSKKGSNGKDAGSKKFKRFFQAKGTANHDNALKM